MVSEAICSQTRPTPQVSVQQWKAVQGCQRSEWILNVKRAPWSGDVFERMIKSTKCCLCKMVGRANFALDELLTAVVEIEAVVNS